MKLEFADAILRKESLLPVGLAIVGLVALALTSEAHVALGLIVFLVLVASLYPAARIAFLILLLPLAHAGLGLEFLPGFGLYDVYAAFFILVFVMRIAAGDAFQPPKTPVLPMTGIMLVAFIPSLLNSIDLGESTKALVQFIASTLTAAGIYYYLVRVTDGRVFTLLLALFTAVAGIIAAYGVYENVVSKSLFQVAVGRVYFGPFQDVNYYASYLIMAFALAGGFIVVAKGLVWRVASVAAFVVLLAAMISTVSRSGIAVLVIVSCLYALYLGVSLRGTTKLISLSFLLLFLGVVVLLVFSGVGSKVVDLFTLARRLETVFAGRDPSIEQRIKILEVGTRIVAAHPVVGVGFGTFEKTYDDYKQTEISTGFSRAAHNTALRILAETGIVGFIPSLLFIILLFRYLGKAYQRIPARREKVLIASATMSLLGFLLMSLTLDMMFEPHFWVILGLTLAFAAKYSERELAEIRS